MNITNKPRALRILYLFCCLAYIGWVGYLGSFDFNRIRKEYRQAGEQTEPGRVRAAALEELMEECLKRSGREPGPAGGIQAETACRSFPTPVLEAREAQILERRSARQERAKRKLFYFSLFFAAMFLIIPPLGIYLIALFAVRIFRSIKIVRSEE